MHYIFDSDTMIFRLLQVCVKYSLVLGLAYKVMQRYYTLNQLIFSFKFEIMIYARQQLGEIYTTLSIYILIIALATRHQMHAWLYASH